VHTWYFAVGDWLSNFCHVFSYPLGILNLKKWSLYKNWKNFQKSWKKMREKRRLGANLAKRKSSLAGKVVFRNSRVIDLNKKKSS